MQLPGNENAQRLHKAAIEDNWNAVEDLIQKNTCPPLNDRLTLARDTALHIATRWNKKKFVKELVTRLSTNDLALQTRSEDTALCIAAFSGLMEIAKILIETRRIDESDLKRSLFKAVHSGQKEMALFLFQSINISQLRVEDRIRLFGDTVKKGIYDIALEILKKNEQLPSSENDMPMNSKALCMLVQMPQEIFNGSEVEAAIRYTWSTLRTLVRKLQDIFNGSRVGTAIKDFWSYIASQILKKNEPLPLCQNDLPMNSIALRTLVRTLQDIFNGSAIRYIWSLCTPTVAYQLLEMIWDKVLRLEDAEILKFIEEIPNMFFEAVKFGNVKFVTLLVDDYLMPKAEKVDRQLLDKPILYRQGKIFNLIYNKKVGIYYDYVNRYTDVDGNNMLHLACKLPTVEELDPPRPNLQLQPEILWFKEMQKIMPRHFTQWPNGEQLKPEVVFVNEHKELINTARTVMNGKASSYMNASAIIVAAGIAAALVVPGTSMGPPETLIFNKDTWYGIFVISSYVAVLSSITSTAMLLSTVTSRFVDSEYITSLRPKMMRGVTALFISLICMVIVIAAAFFLIFNHKTVWVAYFFASLAFFPLMSILLLSYNYCKDGMWLT